MKKSSSTPAAAHSAEEVGQALARGRDVEVPFDIAAECGAEPGDPAELEDVLEAQRRPYGPLEPPAPGDMS